MASHRPDRRSRERVPARHRAAGSDRRPENGSPAGPSGSPSRRPRRKIHPTAPHREAPLGGGVCQAGDMCGRYASSRKPEDLVEEFEVDAVRVEKPLAADYNVAPTKDVYAVMDRTSSDAPADTPAERRLTIVRWGLVPSWAKDISIGNRMINVRMETLEEKTEYIRSIERLH